MDGGKQFRVHALVTDGQITRKLLTVVRTENHFVFVYPIRRRDYHVTYHKNGSVLERPGPRGPVIRKERYSALDDFKGDATHRGAFLNIDKPSTWGSEPSKTKANEEVIIDLRPCRGKTNVVSVMAPLLIPDNLEPVDFYYKNYNVLQCEVFKETTPWFAIIGCYSVSAVR